MNWSIQEWNQFVKNLGLKCRLMKTGKSDKTKENAGICWDKKEKATQEKITI